ncbi:MAG: hypothetical protein H6842_03565 [Rhodospirillaceae bacterium]|nr:hypothetical protein [Rhodospirillaceae bacterium]
MRRSMRRWSATCAMAAVAALAGQAAADGMIAPGELVYQGAFRLPAGAERPQTFDYAGNAMTVNPAGDPSGSGDGYPGSLFLTGHERMPYGELPDGDQVAEVGIPAPVRTGAVSALPRAHFIQTFHEVTGGMFAGMDEIPRVGMLYLDRPETGPLLHLAWGQHFEPEPPMPTHAWVSPALDRPDHAGPWFIDDASFYSINDYMLDIPQAWADAHAQGRVIGTGRFRDGGWSGMGPALYAYRPWTDAAGTPAPAGTRLGATTLLLYRSSTETDAIEQALTGYQHPDEWQGAAWLTTADGRSAVLFAGTKGTGARYWYGYTHPAGPDHPCVDTDFVGQFPVCRFADGTPCPPSDLQGCQGHNDTRGWWSSRFDAQFLLYDPADLAAVADGRMATWAPQPYAVIDIDEHLFLTEGVEPAMLGSGVQRRLRIGDAAFDRRHGLLYLLELFADGPAPVVHVWRVQ